MPEATPQLWTSIQWKSQPAPDNWPGWMIEIGSGWPMISMSSIVRFHDTGTIVRASAHPGIVVAHPQFLEDSDLVRVIPLRPAWPGFAVNTMLYGVALWMLIATLVALRTRSRERRACCPSCAYPIGTNPRCTECGAAVKPKAVAG